MLLWGLESFIKDVHQQIGHFNIILTGLNAISLIFAILSEKSLFFDKIDV
jgi:hypothetical protein